MKQVLPEERLALLAFVLLFLLSVITPMIYARFWIAGMAGVGLVWLVLFLWAVTSIPSALKRYEAAGRRARAIGAMPVAMLAAFLLGPVATWVAAYAFLSWNQDMLLAARAKAGPDVPVAISYIRGIPDGGAAIVHSPRQRPDSLSQAEMIRLTGERIRACRRLRPDTYLCGYD